MCPFVFAQAPLKLIPQKPNKANYIACTNPNVKSTNTNAQAKKAVIWTETFAAGIPSGWTNAGTPAAALWEYRGPATTPNVSVGGRGDCSGGAPITSPTAADGFVIFDSNYLDNNAYCGGGNAGTAPAPQIGLLTTDAINLSAESSVQLTFYVDMRVYLGTYSVNVSNDGGSTWNEVWEPGLAVNASLTGQVTVNITAFAGNQADVRLQFDWDGDYYEWMLDDIVLESAPDNDLVLNEIFFNTTADETNMGTRYLQIPYNQAQLDTLTFGAAIKNQGGAVQPNTTLTVTVTNQGGYSDATTPINLAVTVEDSVNITNTFIPNSGLGTYDITFDLSSDSTDITPANNTELYSFEVTDTVYARDNGDNPMGWQTRVEANQARANAFEIWTQDTATSISLRLGGLGNVGSIISVHLWDTSLTAPIASKSFYTTVTADLAGWTTYDIPDIALVPGVYYAGFEVVSDTSYIHIDNEVPFPLSPIGTYIYNNATDGTGNGGTWYTQINNIPFMRLNTKTPTSICAVTNTSPTITAVTCPGGTDGAISGIVASGGTGPYTYAWTPGSGTNADTSGLAAGNYTLLITDANACVANVVVTVTEPNALSLTPSSTDVTCNGGTDGIASVTATGGNTPLSYLWDDPGTQITASATGLAAGTYKVVVMDANSSCPSDSVNVTVSEPAAMVLTFSSNAENCGGSDGDATVSVTGGTSPFTYLWDDPLSQTNATATGLPAGSYTVMVTDSNGCPNSVTDSVQGTASLGLTTASTNPSACGVADGDATVTVLVGTSPYNYLWNDPGTQTDSTATGLAAGIYTVAVTDINICTSTITVTLTDPGAPTLVPTSNDAICKGDTGSVAVTAFGSGPFTYTWSSTPAQTTSTASGLVAGTYNVTVVDAGGCSNFTSATITEPATAVTITSVTTTDISCNGLTDGTASAVATGGTGTLTYSWSSGGSTQNITGLGAGGDTLTVTDANNCSATDNSTNIVEPAVLGITLAATNVVCNGDGNGTIASTTTGGTGTYSYLWNPGGQTDSTITGLSQGTFTVVVTDANGCQANAGAGVTEPNALAVDTVSTTCATGVGMSNGGAVMATPTGGTGSYTYLWSNGQTTLNLVDVVAATYTLTVSDANNCQVTMNVPICLNVGISEFDLGITFNIHPNPNDGHFVVEMSSLVKDDYVIEIRNIIGQTLHSEIVNEVTKDFTRVFDLSQNERGVYFISISNGEGIRTEKLIVY